LPHNGVGETEKNRHDGCHPQVAYAGGETHANRRKNVDSVDRVLQGDAKPNRRNERRKTEGKRQAVLDQQYDRRGILRYPVSCRVAL
jgi:hypothetical protein